MAASNVISFEQSANDMRRSNLDGPTRELVGNCRLLVQDALPRLMQDLFEKLDDELYALADKSASDALETEYFGAMRELRKLRQPIADGFVQGVLRQFDRFWSQGPQPAVASDAEDVELALLEEEALEEDLAITGMVSKAENRFHRELFALTLRFGHLLGVKDLPIEQNPLAPQMFGDSFRAGLTRWSGELRMRLLIYKLFERHVMAYVGGVYDDLNETLIDRGVLPKIVNRIRRNPVAPAIQRARGETPGADAAESAALDAAASLTADAAATGDGAGADAGSGIGSGDGAAEAELLGLLTRLLHQQRGAPVVAQSVALPTVPATEVLGALDHLQLASAANRATSVEELQTSSANLVNVLQQRLDMAAGGEPSRRFGDNQQDLIDVVSMMFELVLEDRNLPDPMKVLLGRLQIPILKVALLDRSFFAEKMHPARQLLNNLARAAVGWVDDHDRSEKSVYGRIESAVSRVLTEFHDDIDLFETVNTEFVSYLQLEERHAEVAEQRFTQVTQGQEQLALARKRVHEVLFGMLRQYPSVHRAAREMLMEAWKDVLLLSLLREGEDSNSWRNGLAVADKLLWSVLPKHSDEERQRLLKTIPELLKVLRDSLANISYDQHKANRLFKQLQTCHIAALRGDVAPDDTAADDNAVAAEPGVAVDAAGSDAVAETSPPPENDPPAAIEPPADEYQQQARELAVGQWLEWPGDDERLLRGKLCWKSQVTDTFVFVNHKGHKLADLTVGAIATLLREGRARLIDKSGEPLVDRLLGQMVEHLQEPPDAS